MKIAFLGLGRMGAPMARRLVDAANEAGDEVVVWNRTPGRADDLVAAGAREAESVADAARDANVTIVMVFGPEAARQVVGEVITAAAPGSLLINTSTIGPAAARELGDLVAAAGLAYVDAPVLGSVGPASEGRLRILVGAQPAHASVAAEVLAPLGTPDHVGDVGAGSAVKVVYNQSLGLVLGALGETMRLGTDLGIDTEKLLEMLASGPLGFIVNYKRELITRGKYQPATFTVDAMLKDLRLAVEAASRDLPMTTALVGVTEEVAALEPDDDFSAIAGYLASDGRSDRR